MVHSFPLGDGILTGHLVSYSKLVTIPNTSDTACRMRSWISQATASKRPDAAEVPHPLLRVCKQQLQRKIQERKTQAPKTETPGLMVLLQTGHLPTLSHGLFVLLVHNPETRTRAVR